MPHFQWSAFLSAGTGDSNDDILLHNAQQTEPVKVGDRVKVFLYHDPHHRLTASMRLPKVKDGEIAYTDVLLTTKFGAFVDVGTERGIFLPISETIGRVHPGQKIWIKLYTDKTGRLAVTMRGVAEDMIKIAKPAHGLKVRFTTLPDLARLSLPARSGLLSSIRMICREIWKPDRK